MVAFSFTGRIEVVLLPILQTAYSYYFVLRLRKGLPRLLGLLPLFPLSLLVPWRAQTVSERLVLSFLFLWLINTKLLLLVWGMGPAADPFALSTFPRFFFSITSTLHLKQAHQQVSNWKTKEGNLAEDVDGRIASSTWGSDGSIAGDENGRKSSSNSESDGGSSRFVRRRIAAADDGKIHNQTSELQVGGPVQVTAKGGSVFKSVEMVLSSRAGHVVLLRSMFYLIVTISLLRMVLAWHHLMSEYVLVFVLAFYLYFGCLFLFESAAAIPACLLGTEANPQFNMPFLADSLADFWGRRWNLLVNNLLRVSVYEPVLTLLNGRTKATPWGRVIPTAAAFLVSGLMHDVMCFYGSRIWPSWELTAFFMLNGVGTIVEGFLLPPRQRSRVPRVVRWACTMSFVYITGYWLFFSPLLRTGMLGAMGEVGQFIDSIQEHIIWWQH